MARNLRRPAYTLLEILVATAVSVLLMGALYMAISVQLRHAQIGRDVVEQSQLARALLGRIDAEIRLSLGPPVPASSNSANSGGGSSGSGSSTGSGSSSTAGGGSPTASGTNQASGTSSSTSGSNSTSGSSSTSSTTNGTGTVQFNQWIQGDTDWIMLYISRVPRELNPIPGSDNATPSGLSDLRRVSYWLAGGGTPIGLARQEVTAVTSDDAMANVPPNIPDEASLVIAEEVKSLTFSYWDGTTWQDTWDGTTAGADGSTPVGPPLAIAITLGIASPSSNSPANGEPSVKLYRHVVAIPTANGTATSAASGTTSSATSGTTSP